MCYIMNAFQSPVVEVAPSVLAHNNFSLFLTPVNIECINFISLPLFFYFLYLVKNYSLIHFGSIAAKKPQN